MNRIRRKQRAVYRREFRYALEDSRQQDALLSILGRRVRKKGYLKNRITGDQELQQRRAARQETLGSLCDKLDASLPGYFTAEHLDLVIPDVSYVISMAEEGGALLLASRSPGSYEKILKEAASIGLEAVFVDEDLLEQSGIEAAWPVIPVQDGLQKFIDYYRPYRDCYEGRVIGVTGSTGKTTTKEYIRRVADQSFDIFANPANYNSTHNIADNVRNKMLPRYEVFIQEVGGGSIGAVDRSAQILRPDIAVITNVMPHHLDKYKTLENVFADKIQLVERLMPGGTAVVNFDDPGLADYDYHCQVVSFGIRTDRALDYRGVNIRQEGEYLRFDLLTQKEQIPILAKIVGDYNAYNIMAAFAAGRLLGMTDEAILRGIEAYSPTGTRQHVDQFGPYTFFMDCYNVCNETIVGSVRVLEKLPVKKKKGRRIAILGGENKLGELRVEKTEELGRLLADAQVDEIVCYGSKKETPGALNRFGDPKTLYRSLTEAGFAHAQLVMGFSNLVKYLRKHVKPGDAVLYKGIVYLNMPAAVDKVFGTGYSLESDEARKGKGARVRTENGYTGFIVRSMKEAYLTDVDESLLSAKHIQIPDTFADHKVFAVNRGLFAHADASEIDLGSNLRHIGIGAFHGCRNVRKLQIPDSVSYIRTGAFRDCSKLEEVHFGKGIRQIEAGAFDGCRKLRCVTIPRKAKTRIEEGAFPPGLAITWEEAPAVKQAQEDQQPNTTQ